MRHVWINAPRRAARVAALAGAAGFDVTVDCHRGHRGPYTGAGTVLRALVPPAFGAAPELVRRHVVEILCAAPELEALIGPAPATLTSRAEGEERTRWYSRLRTRRIAHGLVELLRDLAAARPGGRLLLAFDEADEADPTDQEFLAIALRRLDPATVRLGVGTGAGELPGELAAALRTYASVSEVDGLQETVTMDDRALAVAYVGSDGTGDEPAWLAAYRALEPAERARLHDERAAELAGRGEFSLALGAIPYHLEHGSDPAGAGYPAGRAAIDHFLRMGFYDAVYEHSMRQLALIDAHESLEQHRYVTLMWIAQSLTMLQRGEEAERRLLDLLARTTAPSAHVTIHYQLGMLYTRHLGAERKDHMLAKAHLNTSIVIAGLTDEAEHRSFHEVFMGNGLALAEMHTGDLDRSYELVAGGLDRLDRELAQDRHLLHRSVLLHNRAQLLNGLGRPAEALADFDRVIEIDPNHAEYYFDRGNARYKGGDPVGAIADYERAMTLTPPFPELFYNRGEARLALGDADGALADYRYVLDLEPDHLEARVSLAALLLEAGESTAAAAEARSGLAELPGDARLLCLLGDALAETGDAAGAVAAFDRALAADPTLYQAFVSRAAIAYEQGRFDDAVADLDRAAELAGDDPAVLFNRGYAHEAAGRPMDAIADYDRALALPGADQDELLAGRDRCLAAAAEPSGTATVH